MQIYSKTSKGCTSGKERRNYSRSNFQTWAQYCAVSSSGTVKNFTINMYKQRFYRAVILQLIIL